MVSMRDALTDSRGVAACKRRLWTAARLVVQGWL